MRVRYIRDYQNGRTVSGSNGKNCDWREIQAIDYSGVNKALNRVPVTSHTMSAPATNTTDGSFTTNAWTNNSPGTRKNILVDLGSIYDIEKIIIARADSPAICHETKLEVSEDNITWKTIFDSSVDGEYQETPNGKEFILPTGYENIELPTINGSINDIINYFDTYVKKLELDKVILKKNLLKINVETSDSDNLTNLINKVNANELMSKLPEWMYKEPFIAYPKRPGAQVSDCATCEIDGELFSTVGSQNGYSYLFDVKQGTWTQKTNCPSGSIGDQPPNGLIGRNFYVLGAKVYGYNVDTNTWATKKSLSPSIGISSGEYGFGGKIKDNIYIGNAMHLYAYDPVTDSFTRKTYRSASYNMKPNYAVTEDSLYTIGGWDGNRYALYDTNEYNAVTDSWTSKASCPMCTIQSASGIINGKLYLIAGQDYGNSNTSYHNLVYDIETNKWEEKTRFPVSDVALCGCFVKGWFYCGFNSNSTYVYVPEFDN